MLPVPPVFDNIELGLLDAEDSAAVFVPVNAAPDPNAAPKIRVPPIANGNSWAWLGPVWVCVISCKFVSAEPTVPATVPPDGTPTIVRPLTAVDSTKPVGIVATEFFQYRIIPDINIVAADDITSAASIRSPSTGIPLSVISHPIKAGRMATVITISVFGLSIIV